VRRKPKEWIPDTVWLNVVALSAMDAFRWGGGEVYI
jgi:dynein heavy chain